MQGSAGDDVLQSTLTMAQGPPDADPLAAELARARAERALFGKAEPARFGRYEIQDQIAAGGMGMVYVAYDPELDRKVALKIVHPHRSHDTRSRHRLLAEGRALAKLDHPNVVKVHDVMAREGQVVIVMELVEGQTLASWEQQARRSWQEIVAVYLQAGDGLAAAHGVGVVHRDFKPSNAIIGTDGRVRVLDFGLARLAAGGDERATTPDGSGQHAALTLTGDVLGTVAYSAPEQLEGGAATAASDQFSFCVSLHHALEGLAPFDGATPRARLVSIRAGRVRHADDGRRVPPWLRAMIARGLSVDPARRYPAMTEVLAGLRRPRGWRRWRLPVLGGALVLGSIAASLMIRPAEPEMCDGGAAQIAGVWTAEQRDRVQRAIDAIGVPYARDVRDRVLATLDGYRTEWRATHRATCRAHQNGAISALLLDREMTCLAQRLGELRAASDVLAHTDAASLPHVMDIAARLPHISSCTDLDRIQAEVAPPQTPELRSAVELVRSQISHARALDRAGRSEQGLVEVVAAGAQARHTGYPPVEIEVALAESKIRISQRDFPGARAALLPAQAAALEHRMFAAAIEASARLIYAEGMLVPDLARLERDITYLLPLSAGLQGDYFARPLLLNNIGTVYQAAGRRSEALRYFEDARNVVRNNDPQDLELSCIDRNVAMLTADDPTRETLARKVWEGLRDALGDSHLATLDALIAYAQYVVNPAQAFELMSSAAEGYRRSHPTMQRLIALTETKRAFLATEMGDTTKGRLLYASAVEHTAGATSDDVVQWHHLCAGELALIEANPERAIAELSITRGARRASELWWERAYALRADVGLGMAEAMRGNDAAAVHYLDEAVQSYPAVMTHNEDVEYRRYLARAQQALAEALRRTGKAPERAAALAQDARTFYRTAGYR